MKYLIIKHDNGCISLGDGKDHFIIDKDYLHEVADTINGLLLIDGPAEVEVEVFIPDFPNLELVQ